MGTGHCGPGNAGSWTSSGATGGTAAAGLGSADAANHFNSDKQAPSLNMRNGVRNSRKTNSGLFPHFSSTFDGSGRPCGFAKPLSYSRHEAGVLGEGVGAGRRGSLFRTENRQRNRVFFSDEPPSGNQ